MSETKAAPPRDVPLSFHHRAIAMKLCDMFDRGDFARLNLEQKRALRRTILCIEQLGELADEEIRTARAQDRQWAWDAALIVGRGEAKDAAARASDDAALVARNRERSRILALPWWRRMLGRV